MSHLGTTVSLTIVLGLGSTYAGCVSPQRGRDDTRRPRRVQPDAFDEGPSDDYAGGSTWTQPRDERRFSEWPDVGQASASAIDGHLAAGDRRFDSGDFHGSIEAYSRALTIDARNSYAFCNRGSARRRLGDYEGAIADLTEAIELRAGYALAYNNRGYALMRSGDPEGAIADYSEAIRLGDAGFPSYSLSMTYRNRAKAHRMVGDEEQARQDDDMAVRLHNRRRVR